MFAKNEKYRVQVDKTWTFLRFYCIIQKEIFEVMKCLLLIQEKLIIMKLI